MTVALAAALLLGVPVAGLAWALARLAETRIAAPGPRLALWTAAIGAAPVLLLSAVVLSFVPQEVATSPAPSVTLEAVTVDVAPTAGAQQSFTLQPATVALAMLIVVNLGAALALIGLALRAGRLAHLLASAAPAEPEARRAVVVAADRLQVRAPRVLRATGVAEPMLAGLVRPALLLPADGPAPDARVLAHELAHLKRGDHRSLWAEALLVALFWFNPFVRLSARRAAAAREEACDALALLGASPEERRLYARTLVDTLRPAAGPPLAIPFGGQGRSPAMRRLNAVLTPAGPARLIERLTVLSLAAAVMGSAVAAAAAQPQVGRDAEAGTTILDNPAARTIIQLNERLGEDPFILKASSQPSGAVCVVAGSRASREAQSFISFPDRLLSADDTANFTALLRSTCPGFTGETVAATNSAPGLATQDPADISALEFRFDRRACVAFFSGEARMTQGGRTWSADQMQSRYARAASGECGPQITEVRLTGSVRVDGSVPASGPDELVLIVGAAPAPSATTVRLPSPTRVSLDGRPLARGELATVAPEAVRGVQVNTRTGVVALRTTDAQQASAPETPPVLANPRWLERPSGADIARAYPAGAAARSVSGRASMACSVQADGSLTACRVLRETPAGEGFGEATRSLAPRFRMSPPETPGASVTIPMAWNLGPAPAPAGD